MSLADFFTAVTHAAASVYHHVLAAETDVKRWSTENPAIKDCITKGVDIANSFFEGLETSKPPVAVVEQGVVAALKHLAAVDTTVNSHATTVLEAEPAPSA